ncbi:IS200/IS605 family transposase [Streptomyces sp. NPDC021212]|uniref:IS200/IS605 family transposase n=1 Tax=Streptomyces sp. NPDC021212 TaxID=3365118 RepID=UPI003789CF84
MADPQSNAHARADAGAPTSGVIHIRTRLTADFTVIASPKYRRPVLGGRVAERLDELIRHKADERGWEIVALEVMPDHVHLFVKHDPKSSASFVANQFKGFTSRVLREEFPHLKSRMPTLRSSSYFAASVGAVSADTVRQYIDSQWERPGKKGDGT